MTWIQTYTGKRFSLAHPHMDDVCIEDIAHALANLGRFTGHTTQLYSVAQHSLWVSGRVPPELRLEALLHDATEAYIGDINSPLKEMLGSRIREIELNVREAIANAFALPLTTHPLVKCADMRALATEAHHLLPGGEQHGWKWPEPGRPSVETVFWEPLSPDPAERLFLSRYHSLRNPQTRLRGLAGSPKDFLSWDVVGLRDELLTE